MPQDMRLKPSRPPPIAVPRNERGGGMYGGGGGGDGDGGGVATCRMTLPLLHAASLLPAAQHEYGCSGASVAEPQVQPTQ